MCCCCCLMQGKDKAADIIKATMPSVALKTTFMWIGFFSSNFHSNPMMKPIEVVSSKPPGRRRRIHSIKKPPNQTTDFPRTLHSPTPKTHTSTCNPPPPPSPSTSPAPSPTTPASSCTPSSPTPPSPCPPSTPSSTPRGAPCKSTYKPG